ncbi:YceI family protein [Paracoccus sp. DMF-8]|uniref:YceI family protein n=1 Tax=Paracoccus sp. DMF-8 TaxID=3019445 RepID=UPI0023E7DFC9|nr:YceI family protein [Paracoccus sp. DMF-8]MDF3605900.1 YceI family protein [Paracoccus sp. DMF-8]
MKTNLLALVSAGALVASLSVATAQDIAAGTYNFDPAHSSIAFEYDHLGFSTSHGLVRGVTGAVTLDPANPANSSVEASFPMSNLVSVAAEMDGHLRGENFFNSPDGSSLITFKSTAVEIDDDGDEAKVTGDLTLNGVTKSVVLDVDLEKAGPHPMTNKPTVGFDAETKILRSEFNLGQFAPAVGDEVEINISVEAVLAE